MKNNFKNIVTTTNTDGICFVFDHDGDDKIYSNIGFSSTRIMRNPCQSIGMISNQIDNIIKASKYIQFHQNNIVSTIDINNTRILSKDYGCDEDNF